MEYMHLCVEYLILILSLLIILFFLFVLYFELSLSELINHSSKALKNLPRDLRAIVNLSRAKLFINKCKFYDYSVVDLFLRNVKENQDKIAIYYQDEVWSFKKLNEYSNQVANCFIELGFIKHDQVSLMMSNRPEYMGICLGLAKIGIATGLINTKLKNDFLLNAINSIDSKAIIFENKYYNCIAEIMPKISDSRPDMKYFYIGDVHDNNKRTAKVINCEPIHEMIANNESNKDNLFGHSMKLHFNSVLFYIYTSGTTGYSKAAIIRHYRYISLGTVLVYMLGLNKSDRIYLSLPLYHGNSCITTSLALIHGMSVVLTEKFSATDFWSDCARYKCTGANYIGEMCRYLLAQPIRKHDRNHCLKIMFGNGLRPKIWRDFQLRFNIPLIGEFYSSTEGNASTINGFGREGSVGIYPYYYGTLLRRFYPIIILKVNQITGEIMRDESGLCISVNPNEVGHIAAKIYDSNVLSYFDGYTNKTETNKKIIRNVFTVGDKACLSGDLVRIDEDGWIIFVDRTGDTFRWKGENVSTADVEDVLQKLTDLSNCIVFGVDVPGCEGKAGMAVIEDNDIPLDLKDLAINLSKYLPSYAIPLFLRLTKKIEVNSSYKMVKTSYVKNSYFLEETDDPIFYYDKNRTKEYLPLSLQLYNDIKTLNIKI